MLKRQRPASPFFASDTQDHPFDAFIPDAKRRRVLPPSLDGPSRGWGPPQAQHSLFADDDEVWDDEPVAEEAQNGLTQPPQLSEYKMTNDLLHGLHAIHQHRIIYNSHSTHPPTITSPSNSHGMSHLSQPPCPKPFVETSHLPQYSPPVKPSEGVLPEMGEVQSVNDLYKDTNKLLGSLVLARRRHLEHER